MNRGQGDKASQGSGHPTPAFGKALDRLAEGAGLYRDDLKLSELAKAGPSSDEAIIALASLVVAHVDAVSELGRRGPQLLPGAVSCARAAFETAANLAWIADPGDPAQREGRWLGWYAADARFWENLCNDLRGRAPNESKYSGQIAAAKAKLVTDIARALQEHLGYEMVALPSLEKRLAGLGQQSSYTAYRQASQVVHGMPDAMGLVTFGDAHPPILKITWATVLWMAWWSLNPLLVAFDRLGVDPKVDEFRSQTGRFMQSVGALSI